MLPTFRALSLLTCHVGLALIPTTPAQAAPIVTFDFNELDATADALADHVTSTNFTAGGGLSSTTFASGAASARGWNPSNSALQALANGDYWEFSVTADAGYQFDVDTFSLTQWRENNGPLAFQLYSGGSLIGSSLLTSSSSTNHVIAAPATALTSVVVRLLAWNASNNGGSADWFVDNVILSGTVTPVVVDEPVDVPEPVSLALLAFGLGTVGARMRKRA
jgi:hypothetical protein